MQTMLKIPTKEQERDKERTIENVVRALNGYTVSECSGILQSVMYHVKNAAKVRVDGYILEK